MIGRLTGKIAEDEGDGGLILDVGGVGYELAVPLGSAGRLRPDEAGRVTFYVHTHVREDTFALFGFPSEADRVAFRLLLSVSSVGPKTALAVMSALPASELARAVAGKDLKALTAITGIGKKTAEMMLLQLRDKLNVLTAGSAMPAVIDGTAAVATASASRSSDVLSSALVGLGYRPADADRAVAALGDRVNGMPIAEALREALAVLAK